MSKSVLTALVAVLIAVAGAWQYLASGSMQANVAPPKRTLSLKPTLPASGVQSASIRDRGNIPIPPGQLSPLARDAGIQASTTEYAWHISSTAPVAPRLQMLLDSNDPSAWRIAARLMQQCSMVLLPMSTRDSMSRTPASLRPMQENLLAELKSRCEGVTPEMQDRAWKLMPQLLDAGDLDARISHAEWRDPSVRAPLGQDVRANLNSQDPVALDVASHYFAALSANGFGSVSFEGQVYTTSQMRDAFALAACDFGADCGPRSEHAIATCVRAGWCGESLQDRLFLQYGQELPQYNLTTAQFAAVLHARDVIVRSVASGTWPEGFWTPATVQARLVQPRR